MTTTDVSARLDHMANQIAAFFRSMPEEQAVTGIADHIRSFWSPTMRRDLVGRVERGEARLDPLVQAAMPVLTKPANAASEAAAGPDDRGEIGACDAG